MASASSRRTGRPLAEFAGVASTGAVPVSPSLAGENMISYSWNADSGTKVDDQFLSLVRNLEIIFRRFPVRLRKISLSTMAGSCSTTGKFSGGGGSSIAKWRSRNDKSLQLDLFLNLQIREVFRTQGEI